MELRWLLADETAIRRYVEELWLPYHRELEATVERHALADDVDLVVEEVEFRLELLDGEDYRAWVAVDDCAGEADGSASTADLAAVDAELAGFVTTDVDESPTVFDRPDRLVVGDVYVREPYRSGGLGRDLLERVAERARDAGCAEVVLDVDVDNDHAVYEALGFETVRRRMAVDAIEL